MWKVETEIQYPIKLSALNVLPLMPSLVARLLLIGHHSVSHQLSVDDELDGFSGYCWFALQRER